MEIKDGHGNKINIVNDELITYDEREMIELLSNLSSETIYILKAANEVNGLLKKYDTFLVGYILEMAQFLRSH
jgi:hypothetical protein